MKSDFVFALENAHWPALLIDAAGFIRKYSPAAKTLFGLEGEPSINASLWTSENGATPEQFLARAERSSSVLVPVKLKIKDGRVAGFMATICPSIRDDRKYYTVQLFKEDPAQHAQETTHFRKEIAAPAPAVEAGLAHKQKLDCALQLTRTVALDFNNALTSILGHTSLILSKMEPNHPWRSSLVEVEKSAEKAAEISHDLAAFSRQEKDASSHVAGNLNDLVRRTVDVFKSPAHAQVLWSLQLESKLYTVNFEEAKMQQAFVKILDNSVQSVGSDGRIIVKTANHDFAEPFRDGNIQLAPGSYSSVEFVDNGCGIPADILPRIFEPFFTTKKGPNHRGLGLAWVYGIITNHGGSVAVSSTSRGTNVRVYLPALKKIVKDRTIKSDDLGGTQTILIVDDEDLLLTMGQMVLSSFGYRVLTANSGQKALEIFAQAPSQIDLVITDLVMPQMSGREVIERLRLISPDLKIICASGFMRNSGGEEDETYLQKPFSSQDLLRKVKQVLTS